MYDNDLLVLSCPVLSRVLYLCALVHVDLDKVLAA